MTGSDAEAEAADVAEVAQGFSRLEEAVSSVIVGQREPLRLAYITLLCEGHSLFEGVPGVAKTLLVSTLSRCLDLDYGRVQFTPDLMPADIVGTPILRPTGADMVFRPGPLFTTVLLADEINRAPAKTQAALLEAMQEGAATVDGTRHPLDTCFTVFATQNPVEQEGTYPLPEAELDRFLFKVCVDYPSEREEVALLARHHDPTSERPLDAVMARSVLLAARAAVRRVTVRDELVAYVAELVRATRADVRFALGASPRAGVMLLRAAKANAALEGRDFALPEDVQQMWAPALRHRVVLDPAAEVEGMSADEALLGSLASVTVPR